MDEETAKVLRKIFSLCIAGLGPMQIAKRFRKEQILNSTAYWEAYGLIVSNSTQTRTIGITRRLPPFWSDGILGHMVNFKGTKKSYKSKKLIKNPLDTSRHLPRHYRTGIMGQGTGITEEQTPPHKDGQAQYVF